MKKITLLAFLLFYSVLSFGQSFEAHVNFQNNPTSTTPPSGYVADYGKGFGANTITVGTTNYQYGWKLASDGLTPIDISDEPSNANGGAGRNRISGSYAGSSIQQQLEGTLVHFQGDNIHDNSGNSSWAGQPRGNEVLWELEIPNGTYDVTISLGDQGSDVDSRHSATVEGYTVVPAFVPTPSENRNATITISVTDGLLTMNGHGGFNSKINYIDVVESTSTPVSGVLAFTPNTSSATIETLATGTFSSILSGSGALDIGIIINDNINFVSKNNTDSNDWLTIPTTNTLGQFDFAIDASTLVDNDTRSNKIIATAQGFIPAELDADLIVEAVAVAQITAPFRMNVFGADYTKDGDLFSGEAAGYLEETQSTTTSSTGYALIGSHADLYYPRRYGVAFSYNFPIANGTYTVALHMVENFHDVSGARIFDVTIEGNTVIDDIDLFASYGKGVLALESFEVVVTDGELNIDFLASVNNAIVQAIEILPAALSDANDLVSFTLADQTASATIDNTAHTVSIEVANGTDVTVLEPTITVSVAASISPNTGVAQDFTNSVDYIVTAEDGTTTQVWSVTVSEAALSNTAPSITSAASASVAENQNIAIDVAVTDDNDIEGPGLTYTLSGLADDSLFDIDIVTGIVTFNTSPDFESPIDAGLDNVYNIQVTVTDSGALTAVQDIAITVTDVIEVAPFEAHVNFQNNPSSTTPPSGYMADYGKGFGSNSITVGTSSYQYGWKLASDGTTPIDFSDEAANNTNGVGRDRLSDYSGSSTQEKLEGTLVHFQGDNIINANGLQSWSGQPKVNEAIWELEIPNGTYDVTISLGDQGSDVDSRHSATVEGYTVVSAFVPTPNENRSATITVSVTDGLLTVNGHGGFNSKINYIDVVESVGTPVSGVLSFTPNTNSATVAAGDADTFSSTLSGSGASSIGIIINDNINAVNQNNTGSNDWLTIPTTNALGQYDFAIDASALAVNDTRSNKIIATAQGFIPAELDADLTVTAGAPFAFIDDFDTYGLGNLHEIAPANWSKENGSDPAIPVVAEGLTPSTSNYLDFSAGNQAHDLIPLGAAPVSLTANTPFYFGTYFKVTSTSGNNRVRVAIRIDDAVSGDQWVREQVAFDNGGLIARIGLGGAGSDNGNLAISSDEVFQFVVRGEWDGTNTITYSWTTKPTLDINNTVWTSAGTHTVQGTPEIGRMFISSSGTNNAKLGPIRLAESYALVVTEEIENTPIIADQTFGISEDVAVGATVGTVVASDVDSTNLTYAITTGNTNTAFEINSTTGVVTTLTALDFEVLAQYQLGVTVSDGSNTVSATVTINVTDINEVTPFEAHVNFQNNPTSTTPPSGYVADYGKGFGANTITVGTSNYQYGWKLASDGTTPIDFSDEAANNTNGVGRDRLSDYSGASTQEKLEGTLVHFQGDNIINANGLQSWSGQPKVNEAIWELEIPNGVYEVTIGLGDKAVNSLDSRHSATIEGYTIIPAFIPSAGQTVVATMVVEVSDGLLTMNGHGGFNTKITHIDVVESAGTPVSGVLAFTPNSSSATIETGATDTFSSTLSGSGASNIGIVINDNINAVDQLDTGSNDWLTIPTTNALGQFNFAMDATTLVENDTRSNKIIATAQGFIPAELDADLTVEAVAVAQITAPFRMNVFGADYTKDGDLFSSEAAGYLEETQSTTTANSIIDDYVIDGHTELYYPRRYGVAFSYNFPIANGTYTVALHMVENYQTTSGARIFDVTIEGNTVIDDLDLFASYGKGALGLESFEVVVIDGELNIDFLASVNNAIVQAIEILPAALSDANDLVSFILADQTGSATIDNTAHTVSIEVANGTDVTSLEPIITVSAAASISPNTGVAQDFTNSVDYIVTAEDGTTTQAWAVTVSEAAPPCSPLSTLACQEIEIILPLQLDFTVANGNLSDSGFTMVLEPSTRLTSDDALAHANVTGYAPTLIGQNSNGVSITSTKGIFYNQPVGSPSSNNTNSQMNALGTGFTAPTGTFSITSTLENPDFSGSTGNSAQQAGIWFGLDEDHYIKLAVIKTSTTARKIQLQVENMDNTTQGTAFLEINTGNITSNTGEITLRLELDPEDNTVKGYYAIDGGAEILVADTIDFLPVPTSYFLGTSYDTANPSNVLNFAGIFTTHRNAAVDQSITAVFKDFEIVADAVELVLAFADLELDFAGNIGTAIPIQTTTLYTSTGNPSLIFSDDPDASTWLNLPTETEAGEITFGIKENVPAGIYSTIVFAQDQPDLGYANASITINLEITEIQTPAVVGVTPTDGATGISVNASISANDLFLPNFDGIGNTGVDNLTITSATVKLYKQGNLTPITASVNGTGGGDAISLVPAQPLESNTTYVFEIDGVLDTTGEEFAFFTSSFTTGGGGGGGPTTDLDNVSFDNAGSVASGSKFSSLTIGPDNKLYGLEIDGDIHRWDMNADGTLANEEVLSSWKSSYGSRAAIGFTFDPDATAANLIVYITHQSGALSNAPAWDGKISRLTGTNLENENLIVTNLPRSKKDHLTNSIAFRPSEPNVLYFNQGSNSAAGAPDNAWGNRKERLLSGATLRLDLDKLPEGQWPLNAKTTMDPTAINTVNINAATLVSTVATYTEDGQSYADDGVYNPYYTNASLTLYATGVRNAYDLVWHTNGQLYVPANGTAGGSNAPASIDGTRRPDGTFYNHSDSNYPQVSASNSNNVQHDWLFRIDPNSSLGYYGHPNPLRGEFVLNRGDADVNNAVYNGVTADINYRGDAFDFEYNKSPNGVIEYRSNAENGNLQGAILVVRYSGGSDIIALVPDGANGDITTYKEGIPGFTGFIDPLDLIEDVSTGNIYVADYGSSTIVLLKPSNQSVPQALIVVSNEDFTGDAVTSGTNTYSEEITISNLGNATLNNLTAQITGADAGQFSFLGLPSTIASQNSGSFTITFDPASNGPKYAELTLTGTGTDTDPVVISLSGLGKTGTGGTNEPSLQWILDTHLGTGVVNVGDSDTATNLIDLAAGLDYNDILGDEVAVQQFERAADQPITIEVLSVYGPTDNNPIVAFGWYASGDANSITELFDLQNTVSENGQTLNPTINGVLSFDPGIQSFGFVSRWPYFNDRQLFSEDVLNSFTSSIPHHVRVYELPGEDNAYIVATEEHISGFDYQDIVVVVRNIKPYDGIVEVACSPISTLECNALEVSLPFALDFDGTEGGLSDTGFTMVDNPSARLAVDGPISNVNVPGYEPSQLNISNGNLIITANNGIAYVDNGTSSDVNSQINTLGVGIDASSYGNFSITTSIVNPYTDADDNAEQAGIWFGLNEDNFVKLVANGGSNVELRTELNAVSVGADQVVVAVPNLNTSTVQLRLFVNVDANELTAYYTLNSGAEVEVGTLPLPGAFINGNSSYDDISFAGVFASKRREDAATVVTYTIEDFSITSDDIVAFQPIKINFSLPEDVPPTGYLVDSGLGFAERGNSYSYGWLTTDGQTSLNLATNARNRGVASVAILQNTLVHMQYGDVDNGNGTNGITTEGIWEIAVPNGNYIVSVGVGDPEVDASGSNDTPNHTINVEGVNIINQYIPTGSAGASTRFTSGTTTVDVTDGLLTIDASGGHNTKINSLTISEGSGITQPYFTNVTPINNANNVAITDFQINVEVITPAGYELDKTTYAGNVNLYEVTTGGEVLVPSNSNDTGGGDAITLTPLNSLKTYTTYIFRLTDDIEANLVGDINDRLSFAAFESQFTTGDENDVQELDLTGVSFTKVEGGVQLGDGTSNQRFSSLVIGPDEKLYASTIGDFSSDGKIYRWSMAADGTLENLEILTPELQGATHPVSGARSNNDRLIIGLAFDPASTANNLIAYVTHSAASVTDGPEWDGVLSKLSGPNLSVVEDLIIHLPRSGKDHLTNSIAFDSQGVMYITQGSNSAGGAPDPNWVNRPERLLAGAILKVELNKLPATLPLSAYTTDNISVINSATSTSSTMSDGTYNPYATNAPLSIYASGVRNAYDLVWHSNGWLYVPTNGTAGNNSTSPNSPATADYTLARRIDGLTTIPDVPALNGGETQKDWLFKTQGGSYHGHPNPYRGEFVLNHGGVSYSGLPGQAEASYTDVAKYPDNLVADPNYREPAFDFGKNKSPNGAIEYQSNAFGGKLQGLLMVVRFSGQDDILVMQPKSNGDIGNVNGDVTGLGGFDDPLDVVEDPRTGNIYISEYDRDNNGTPRLTLLRATTPATIGPEIAATPDELIFEITVNSEGENTDVKTVSVSNDGTATLNITGASIAGSYASQFDAVQPSGSVTIQPGETQEYTLTYAPDLDGSDLGYQEASLVILNDDTANPSFEIGLHALKKAGFEGGEEPALQAVVDALGIGINVGWTTLANGTDSAPIGDESEVELWVKAGDEPINVTPVGRYSPAEELPFGWYTNDAGTVTMNEVAVLEDGLDNAQTLFPPISTGDLFFDPLGAVFGFYVDSNSFDRTNYTEDALNAIQPTGVMHRTRIYPMSDRDGNPIENSYLIAFEDAANGDYQDYMFIIDNVIPYEDGTLVLDFNKDNMNFVAAINQEVIATQQVVLTGNGGITSGEINVTASEDWVVLPANFEFNSTVEIGIDKTGLPIGNYQATITATAPNYQSDVINIDLNITNELIYAYQFNFQDPDDVEVSPEGYIDDLGVPYSVQSTSLGDLNFGWVEPGTLIPADAAVNSRNRGGDALLSTFTIIGHNNGATYPLRDWLVDVPNGSYSVHISVGDSDFSDSNHVLDVNGVTVVDYDQENEIPETFGNYEETGLVEVIDGTLRLSLNASGANAKPNFIRLAPISISSIPPTLTATFDGNTSEVDTYRGVVSISLEAIDESESGSIVRLEYVLDANVVESYSTPINVSAVGSHVLVATAEDANGNITTQTYNFIIETASGALLAMENMTKVPGTDRGFPANDYYTFHRLGDPGQAVVHDANVMRLNNPGSGALVVTEVVISNANNYTYELLDNAGDIATLPITVASGSYADLDITFIGGTSTVSNGIFVENIEVVSNADNALENVAILHGAYSPQPEGGDEINAQEVFDAFGFESRMLSIVNDAGTITPVNGIPYRPSSNYPIAENIDAGYEGDLILSSTFVQADPNKPIIGIQLSAFHGGPGSNGAKFVQANGTSVVGGINFSHDANWYQTLLPQKGSEINFDTSASINEPFRIAISNYLSSGGNNINGARPDLLGLRIYKVIDHNGTIIPNEYIGLQDFVQGGCGAGSANCDWNDNTFYFINIRPEAVPTALPIDDLFVSVEDLFTVDSNDYFDKGYPGNALEITATVNGESLPSWMSFNAATSILSGTPPLNTTGDFTIVLTAEDTNELTASTSVIVTINEPPVATDDNYETEENSGITLLLLENDFDPNGQIVTIVSVETPQNGTTELNIAGTEVQYTPNTDYVGSDSFTYIIEDETGISATANVTITVNEMNQAPVAVITTNTTGGDAALYVEFDGSGSTDDTNNIDQYLWDFGDGVGSSADSITNYTYHSTGTYQASLTVTDNMNLSHTSYVTITVTGVSNTTPNAVASIFPIGGSNTLQFNFDGSGSNDAESTLTYAWNFGDGTAVSTMEQTQHSYAAAGTYTVTLIVTDIGNLTDTYTMDVVANDPVIIGDFALRINSGGPELIHNGDLFIADQYFDGNRTYTNTSATVSTLYQTERSANPPTFGYNIPLDNGDYRVLLHFAEIYWGATEGGDGGAGKRVFDVLMEGATILDDFDINAAYGSETELTKTFEVTMTDGILNLIFDATGSDGVNQPKLSGIEILGLELNNEIPLANAGTDQSITLPTNSLVLHGIGSDPDGGLVSYQWTQISGANTAALTNASTSSITVANLVEGDYVFRLTVTDDENTTAFDEVSVTVLPEVIVNDFALRINSGGPELTYNGDVFIADQYFDGGKSYANTSATVSTLYHTERSASPPTFGYDIPLENGGYRVVLHFAEIYWGATEGGDGGTGKRVFDVAMEGATILDDFDINTDSGPQTEVTKTFDINMTDGTLNLIFDAAGSDGVNQPKLSAIEILGLGVINADPIVNAGTDQSITLPTNNLLLNGSGSDPDGGLVSYQWTQISGANTAALTNASTSSVTVANLVEGDYVFRLTVTDDESATAFDEVSVTVLAEVVINDFALRINAGGPEMTHEGDVYSADQYFDGGKIYSNTSATVSTLYQTERIASLSTFGYDIPLDSGDYRIVLHFAEIYWGATGGGDGGLGKRVFDVVMEGATILDDFDINAAYGPETEGVKTFDVTITDGTLSLIFDAAGSDGVDLPKLSAIEILGLGVINVDPIVNAGIDQTITLPTNSLVLNGSGSDPDGGLVSYQWTQISGANTAALTNASTSSVTVANMVEGDYVFRLTVTDDESTTAFDEVSVTVLPEVVINDFALRINSGGPELTHNGDLFIADQYFDGNRTYSNTSATVSTLYQTERSANPPTFGYNIPLDNGDYRVVLHFAEIYWGATDGGDGGAGKRVFDVVMEGATILDDFDINAAYGSETELTKAFDVTMTDGILNLIFDATGSDGVDQPKLSGIEILGVGLNNEIPIASAGTDQSITLPTNSLVLHGIGSDPDGGLVSYQWTQISGANTAVLTNASTSSVTVANMVEGDYVFRLTVTDDESTTAFDEVSVTVLPEVVINDFALRINSGGPELTHNGDLFIADQYFDGNRTYSNTRATVSTLYQTERSANPPTFGYNIPLDNGDYRVVLHFAEIYWGATEGGDGGAGKRVFDVVMEGATILDDFDINAAYGSETELTKTFEVTMTDGILNLFFDATGSDGVDQPKLSGIEILGKDVPNSYTAKQTNSNSNMSSNDYSKEDKSVEITQNSIEILPNPASIEIQVRLSDASSDIAKLLIYDMAGRLVRDFNGEVNKASAGEYYFNVSTLESGIYYVIITSSDESISKHKLIIKN